MQFRVLMGLVMFAVISQSAEASWLFKSDEEKALLEKAWSCNPDASYEYKRQWYYTNGTKPSEVISFSGCYGLSEEEKNKLAKVLLDEYSTSASRSDQSKLPTNFFDEVKSHEAARRAEARVREEEAQRLQEVERQRIRDEREKRRSERLANPAKLSEDVEKAWFCEPERKGSEVFSFSRVDELTMFMFRRCNELSESEKRELAELLVDKYSEYRQGANLYFLTAFDRERTKRMRVREEEESKRLEEESKRLEEERRKKEEAEKLAKAAAEAAVQAEKVARQMKLRSGEIKIQNMDDAFLAQEKVLELSELMPAPLIKPDGQIYGGTVEIDAEESTGVLRAKWDARGIVLLEAHMMRRYGSAVFYAQLKRTKKTVAFMDNMRIGQSVKVIGRYVGNRKFNRVDRTEGTMPVLEILYIGN